MKLHTAPVAQDCFHSTTRRGFLKRSLSIAAGSIPILPWMFENNVRASQLNTALNDPRSLRNGDPWVLQRIPGKSLRPIIWISLDGGANQKATFDPAKPNAALSYASPF